MWWHDIDLQEKANVLFAAITFDKDTKYSWDNNGITLTHGMRTVQFKRRPGGFEVIVWLFFSVGGDKICPGINGALVTNL